jgi:hypothetical protein
MAAKSSKFLIMLLRVLQFLMAAFIVGVASYHTWEFASKRLLLSDDKPGQIPKALYAIMVIVGVHLVFHQLGGFANSCKVLRGTPLYLLLVPDNLFRPQ